MSAANVRPDYPANALPPGTRLGEFEILDVLGLGGFGIVYRALDHALEREVAIKEYMPSALAGRTATLQVTLRSGADAATFAAGLRSFVNEARLLARFDHPSLLKVYRYWEANETAYMAMPVYRGRTLKAVRLAMPAAPDEAWLRALLMPLLGAIETLHAQDVYHRDIAPDNILIEPDGRPVLLDFGAARRVIGDRTQALTAILKPSYAPIEQYADAGAERQGPWTDLYALGATLHFVLVGRPPPPATARALRDQLPLLAPQDLPGWSPLLRGAVDWMLRMQPAQRPQSVQALRAVLDGQDALPILPGTAPARAAPAAALDLDLTQFDPAPSPAARASTPPPAARADAPPPAVRADAAPPAEPSALQQTRFVPSLARGDSGSGANAAADPTGPVTNTPSAWGGDRAARRTLPLLLVVVLALAAAGVAWWQWRGAASARASGPAPGSAASAATTSGLTRAGMPDSTASAASASSTAAPEAAAVPAPDPAPSVAATAPALAGSGSATTSAPARVLPRAATSPAPAPAPAPALTRTAAAALPASAPPPAPAPAPGGTTPAASPSAALAPASTPAPAAGRKAEPAAPSDEPSAICGGRVLLALMWCMERECARSENKDHPACRKWFVSNRQRPPP